MVLVSNEIIEKSGIKFGTSGARGLVEQFTPDVCSAFAYSFVASLREQFKFDSVAIAIDNRPSSLFMAKVIASSVKDMGLTPIYFGVIPTPALAYSSMSAGIPSIMVTGSHIPFDRNGIKFYRPDGEISKKDEQIILHSKIKFHPPRVIFEVEENPEASRQYIERYANLFDKDLLNGKRIGIYEHSSAGRDIYRHLFEKLGAEVISLGRTNDFVAIDTEAVSIEDQNKAMRWTESYNLDMLFSTDGDGDRPLVAGEDGVWLRGDILGLLCAEQLEIEAVAVPVNCNSIIENSKTFKTVAKTKIGSPYVISELEGFKNAFKSVAGFEANGGFILGSNIQINGKILKALPTRDAVLPALIAISATKGTTLTEIKNRLQKRFTFSDRIQNFDSTKSKKIISLGLGNAKKLMRLLDFKNVEVLSVNSLDGLKIILSDGKSLHFRASGNAPEFRCYSEADTFEEAKALVAKALSKIQKLEI